jgi:hypothetical protein
VAIGTALIDGNRQDDPIADGQEVTTIFETETGQAGFDDSMAMHFGPPPLPHRSCPVRFDLLESVGDSNARQIRIWR